MGGGVRWWIRMKVMVYESGGHGGFILLKREKELRE